MSLVCTPQRGKVLNYNSSVNSQLVHKKVQLTIVTSGNKIAQKEEKLLKREKYEIRDSGDGELVPGLRRTTT